MFSIAPVFGDVSTSIIRLSHLVCICVAAQHAHRSRTMLLKVFGSSNMVGVCIISRLAEKEWSNSVTLYFTRAARTSQKFLSFVTPAVPISSIALGRWVTRLTSHVSIKTSNLEEFAIKGYGLISEVHGNPIDFICGLCVMLKSWLCSFPFTSYLLGGTVCFYLRHVAQYLRPSWNGPGPNVPVLFYNEKDTRR